MATQLVTRKLRIHTADQIRESLSEAVPNNLYLFIGRIIGWSGNNIPQQNNSIQYTDYDIWREMIALKRVQASDITLAIPKRVWTNNHFYSEYDPYVADIYANTFYVFTSDDKNVYKCLFNNKGANSTIKPTGTSAFNFTTGDGYIWKYMFTVSTAESLKFETANFIPVKYLSANDGSTQWVTQSSAANSSIDVIDIRNSGSNYLQVQGHFSSISNGTVLTLPTGSSLIDNQYNGSRVYILGGLGSGQLVDVVDYDALTRKITVNPALSPVPNTSSTFILSPKVNVIGDGEDAKAYSNVASGQIAYINVINVGRNYSKATVTISANSGTGATAVAYIAPSGGHGSDPVEELGGHNVMINVKLNNNESGALFVDNDFRSFGILKDPVLYGGVSANSSVYNQAIPLSVSSVSANFHVDEKITGSTSGATAEIVHYSNTGSSEGILYVNNLSYDKSFVDGEQITSNTTAMTAIITEINTPSIRPYSGDVLYVENRNPVARAIDQTEDFKIIIKY